MGPGELSTVTAITKSNCRLTPTDGDEIAVTSKMRGTQFGGGSAFDEWGFRTRKFWRSGRSAVREGLTVSFSGRPRACRRRSHHQKGTSKLRINEPYRFTTT